MMTLRAVMQIAGNESATREKLRHIIEQSMTARQPKLSVTTNDDSGAA
jgi:hypothetical protein